MVSCYFPTSSKAALAASGPGAAADNPLTCDLSTGAEEPGGPALSPVPTGRRACVRPAGLQAKRGVRSRVSLRGCGPRTFSSS